MTSFLRLGSSSVDFPTEYIDFKDDDDLSDDEKTYKQLTFLGASAVSLLCYEDEDKISDTLRTEPRYRLIRENGIISDIWTLADVSRVLDSGASLGFVVDTRPVLAWSTQLQALFVGFRGTETAGDILSDIDARQTALPALASRVHRGFFQRAKYYATLIRQLTRKYKVIVCGHSMG